MENEKKSGEKILDLAGDMVENYRSLITIKVVEQASLAGSASILGIVLLVIVSFVLLFIGIGFAWWLGEETGNMKAGFFIVGGVYTVLLLVMSLVSKKLLLPLFRNIIIKKIYDED